MGVSSALSLFSFLPLSLLVWIMASCFTPWLSWLLSLFILMLKWSQRFDQGELLPLILEHLFPFRHKMSGLSCVSLHPSAGISRFSKELWLQGGEGCIEAKIGVQVCTLLPGRPCLQAPSAVGPGESVHVCVSTHVWICVCPCTHVCLPTFTFMSVFYPRQCCQTEKCEPHLYFKISDFFTPSKI